MNRILFDLLPFSVFFPPREENNHKKLIFTTFKRSTTFFLCFTYTLSICVNFMSIEWIVVKTDVFPWTTHSRVSGMAIGVQVARKTGSFRLQSGRQLTKWPCTSTTFWSPNRIWRRAFRDTFIRQRNCLESWGTFSGVVEDLVSSVCIVWWSCFSMMS